MYWATLARGYVPPGLLPRETPGPKRLRRAGTTVQFVSRAALPRVLLRRADLQLTVSEGAARGSYALAIADATTEPTVLGRPTLFALRRRDAGGAVEALRVSGRI